MRALVFVRETTQISNMVFRDLTGLDTLAADGALRKLRQFGLLEQRGKGATTFYVASPGLAGSIASIPLAPDEAPLTMHDRRTGLHDKRPPASADLSEDLKRKTLHIRMGRRADPDTIRELIVELCRYAPHSKEKIAALLGREPGHIAQAYLCVLVREGRLDLAIRTRPAIQIRNTLRKVEKMESRK